MKIAKNVGLRQEIVKRCERKCKTSLCTQYYSVLSLCYSNIIGIQWIWYCHYKPFWDYSTTPSELLQPSITSPQVFFLGCRVKSLSHLSQRGTLESHTNTRPSVKEAKGLISNMVQSHSMKTSQVCQGLLIEPKPRYIWGTLQYSSISWRSFWVIRISSDLFGARNLTFSTECLVEVCHQSGLRIFSCRGKKAQQKSRILLGGALANTKDLHIDWRWLECDAYFFSRR